MKNMRYVFFPAADIGLSFQGVALQGVALQAAIPSPNS